MRGFQIIIECRKFAINAKVPFKAYSFSEFLSSNFKFILLAQFLNPKTALKFHVRPEFNAIPGFSEITDSEFSGYRLLCREFSSPSGNEFTLEDLRTEAQSIKDFWDGSGANLPILSKIGRTYGFLVGSSCVERIFTYYNRVLSADRASLNSETIKQLMFLYCNSDLN